jgi:hypothetical protein
VEGLILVRTQLLQMLQDEGLERIPVLGLPFDPHVAEAVGTMPVEDSDQHHVVVQEALRGYRIRGRIARAARVVIGEYAGEAAAAARRPKDTLIGEATPPAVPAIVMDAEPEPEAVPEPQARPASGPAPESTDSGPSLEEIIARAEARETEAVPEEEEPEILYDDLTELAEVEDVVRPDDDSEE